MQQWIARYLREQRLPESYAALIADVLLDADCWPQMAHPPAIALQRVIWITASR